MRLSRAILVLAVAIAAARAEGQTSAGDAAKTGPDDPADVQSRPEPDTAAPYGTDPCVADTDGDTVPDNEDDLPTEPGVTSGFIEDELRGLAQALKDLPLEVFEAPNNNARKGRRTALRNKLQATAKQVANEAWEDAISRIENDLLPKLDSASPPADWMVESEEKFALHESLEQLAFLISLLLEP